MPINSDELRHSLLFLPVEHWEPITRYLEKGTEPTGFLAALLADDRMGMLQYATSNDKAALYSGDYYIFRKLLPPASWGSVDKVRAWCRGEHQPATRVPEQRPGEPTYNELARALRAVTRCDVGTLATLEAAKRLVARVRFDDDPVTAVWSHARPDGGAA